MGEPVRCEDTSDAEALTDVVVRAADLVHGAARARSAEIDDFAAAVASLRGVRAVTVLPPTGSAPGGTAADDVDDRGPTMPLHLPACEPQRMLVELCSPDDNSWPGATQECRLRAALALVASAAEIAGHEPEQARLRELVHHLNAAVLVEDTRGRTILANDAFARMFGRADGQQWVNAERGEVIDAVSSRCQDGLTVLSDLSAIADAGEKCLGYGVELVNGHSISLDFVPIRDRTIDLGALWYFLDITEFATTQHELRERNRVLTEAAELNNHFLAAVSHELRTPLTAVTGFAEILREPGADPHASTQRAAVEAIARNAERLMRLVNDLLLLTQLERHALPIHRSSVDVPELVRHAVADREPDAQRAGVTITVATSDGPPLIGDAERLHQVLGNLLGNAVKFTVGGGTVELRARHTEQHWVIEVADSGIGIPELDLRHITGSFVRGGNAISRRLSGSGLGLAICRQIVDLHHGELDIASAVDKGTTVRMTLPLNDEEAL